MSSKVAKKKCELLQKKKKFIYRPSDTHMCACARLLKAQELKIEAPCRTTAI